MKIKRFLPIIVLATSLLLSGCVTQKDYDALLAERDSLQAEVNKLNEDVQTLQEYSAGLQEEIAAQEEQIDLYEKELEQKNALIEDLGNRSQHSPRKWPIWPRQSSSIKSRSHPRSKAPRIP